MLDWSDGSRSNRSKQSKRSKRKKKQTTTNTVQKPKGPIIRINKFGQRQLVETKMVEEIVEVINKPEDEMTFAETLAATFEKEQKLFKGVTEIDNFLRNMKKDYSDVHSEYSNNTSRTQRKMVDTIKEVEKEEEQKRWYGAN